MFYDDLSVVVQKRNALRIPILTVIIPFSWQPFDLSLSFSRSSASVPVVTYTPLLAYASNLQYCDDPCSPMDDMTIDEYREHYKDNFASSVL